MPVLTQKIIMYYLRDDFNSDNSGLLSLLHDEDYTNNKHENKIIVRKEFYRANMPDKHVYELHDTDSLSRLKRHKLFGTPKMGLHEVILESKAQKMRYDVDAKIDTNVNIQEFKRELIDNLIDCITTSYKELCNIEIKACNLLVYDSSGVIEATQHGDQAYKVSYHVIVDKHYFASHLEASKMCSHTYELLDPKFKPYLDTSVYKSTQNFRLSGSCKTGSRRVKRLINPWIYNGNNIHTEIWNETIQSLITTTSNCDRAYVKIDLSKQISISYDGPSIGNIPETTIMHYVNQYMGDCFELSRQTRENTYSLIRKFPSHCNLCNRVHESDNAIVYLSIDGSLKFKCWRNNVDVLTLADQMVPENNQDGRSDSIGKAWDTSSINGAVRADNQIAKDRFYIKPKYRAITDKINTTTNRELNMF
ncbi:MAG: hypothetical protein GY751_13920 [Bacteroidetes bacterium]|nr:hypothetical protein [Bacteroidota bacterium]